jgi:hypothetical protein
LKPPVTTGGFLVLRACGTIQVADRGKQRTGSFRQPWLLL